VVYSGEKIIKYLIDGSNEQDSASSSYWNQEHRDFYFNNGLFSGVGPIGGYKKRNFIINFIHKIFQYKYLRMGRRFPEFKHINSLAKKITQKQNRIYNLDVLRQVLSISSIEYYCKDIPHKNDRTACVIGDGYATATSLLLEQKINKIVLVNLTKTLLIDVHFLKIWLGKEAFQSSVSLVTNKQDLTQCMNDKDNKIIVIEAKNQELIKDCGIDLFINIASMQEMNPKIINQYFNDLKNSNNKSYFYCCNREKKTLPDGTIVKFSDYPWGDASIVLDELCPWYLDFYNKTPPFFHNYDGLIRHRIVRFGES
jgi:hypothetical protein